MKNYISPTDESAIALFSRNIQGEVVMLNLLRLRETADYSLFPHLAPEQAISGRQAYQKYMDHTQPFLEDSGGSILFVGEGGSFLVGPMNERWDLMVLIRQRSVEDFMAFAQNKEYLKGVGHREAALLDSRLLPLVEL